MSAPVGVPGWDADPRVAAWAGLPPLEGPTGADACVVGLGGSGLAAVQELAARGLSVVGVDAGRVAAGAGGRNGGLLLGGPAPFLHDALAAWGEPAAELYRATLAELDHLSAVLGPAVVRRDGSLRLAGLPGEPADDAEAADRAREEGDCAAHAAALRACGIAVEEVDGAAGRGLLLPDDGQVNPVVRVTGLAGHLLAEHRGRVRLHERTPVVRVGPGEVVTPAGTVRAPVVVVAVDGRLEALLPQLGGAVRTARLQMLATAPLAERVLPCGAYFRWGYDYAQQDATGRLLVGGGRDADREAEWTSSTDPTPRVQAHVERVASRVLGRPLGGREVTHRWGASVGYTQDARPLCAPVEDGVVAVGGYSGTGNLVGPVAARAAVALLLDGTPPPRCFTSTPPATSSPSPAPAPAPA